MSTSIGTDRVLEVRDLSVSYGKVEALSTNVDGIQLGQCFTRLAKQADGSVIVRCGDTVSESWTARRCVRRSFTLVDEDVLQ